MKKILALLICLVLVIGVFAIPCFAETGDEIASDVQETEPNASIEDEKNAQDDSKTFYNEFIAEITSVANWAELGVLLTGIIALIAAIHKCIKPITTAIAFLKDKFAKREDVEAAVSTAVNSVREEYRAEYDNMRRQYDTLQKSNDRLTTIVVLAFTHMKINPTAKAEIMNMITGTKQVTGDVCEVVTKVEEAIAEAYASEEKIDTPALDSITQDVGDSSSVQSADPVYIPLGG